MKTVFCLRHAQAASAQGSPDIERALTPQGLEDAAALGVYMRGRGYCPDLVLCSGALRTRQTCEQVFGAFGGGRPDIRFVERIYTGGCGDLLSLIDGTDDNVSRLMLIGHNPSIYELCARLSGCGPDVLMARLTQGFSPATLGVIEAPCDTWSDLAADKNTLADLVNSLDYNAPEKKERIL